MLQPRSPERDDLNRALREITATASALRRFAQKLEQNPNMLLFDHEESEP